MLLWTRYWWTRLHIIPVWICKCSWNQTHKHTHTHTHTQPERASMHMALKEPKEQNWPREMVTFSPPPTLFCLTFLSHISLSLSPLLVPFYFSNFSCLDLITRYYFSWQLSCASCFLKHAHAAHFPLPPSLIPQISPSLCNIALIEP